MKNMERRVEACYLTGSSERCEDRREETKKAEETETKAKQRKSSGGVKTPVGL